MICQRALPGRASHWASGLRSVEGNGSPARVFAHGKTKLDWTQYPTKAAMAMRPCLISAWRRKPMVDSSPWFQKSALARERGSKYPMVGFRSFESFSRSSIAEAATAVEVGATAAASAAGSSDMPREAEDARRMSE